jgi:hypothetical protein
MYLRSTTYKTGSTFKDAMKILKRYLEAYLIDEDGDEGYPVPLMGFHGFSHGSRRVSLAFVTVYCKGYIRARQHEVTALG